MSINIEINEGQLKNNSSNLQMHYLPANINGDGEANVEQYFNNYTCKENGYMTNAMRGYPIVGEKISVPQGYKGLVLQETRRPLDENAERQLRITGTFESINYWNYDKIPTKADAYKQALQILDASKALAKPITEADVLKEIKKREQNVEKN